MRTGFPICLFFMDETSATTHVSTVSGINETLTATCREQVAVTVSLVPDTIDTVL